MKEKKSKLENYSPVSFCSQKQMKGKKRGIWPYDYMMTLFAPKCQSADTDSCCLVVAVPFHAYEETAALDGTRSVSYSLRSEVQICMPFVWTASAPLLSDRGNE